MTRSLLLLIITAFISVSACGEAEVRLGASGDPGQRLDQGLSRAVHGPACADLESATGVYDGATLRLLVTLAASPCKSVEYVLTVYGPPTAGGYRFPLATVTGVPVQGADGSRPMLAFTSTLPSASGVCARITTAAGGRVFDRAPEVEGSCYPFSPGSVAEYAMQ